MVDQQVVPLTPIMTPVMHLVLPDGNVFGVPAGRTGTSVGYAYATLIPPLAVGTHHIVGPLDPTGVPIFDTTIIVTP
jgi:hypothetical protein